MIPVAASIRRTRCAVTTYTSPFGPTVASMGKPTAVEVAATPSPSNPSPCCRRSAPGARPEAGARRDRDRSGSRATRPARARRETARRVSHRRSARRSSSARTNGGRVEPTGAIRRARSRSRARRVRPERRATADALPCGDVATILSEPVAPRGARQRRTWPPPLPRWGRQQHDARRGRLHRPAGGRGEQEEKEQRRQESVHARSATPAQAHVTARRWRWVSGATSASGRNSTSPSGGAP